MVVSTSRPDSIFAVNCVLIRFLIGSSAIEVRSGADGPDKFLVEHGVLTILVFN